MKNLFLTMLLLLAANASWAETALFVHQKSGGVLEVSFSEKPVVTYSEGYLVITGTNGSVSYPLSDMQKFTFGDVDENVTRIVAPESAAPQPTFIYSIDGKLMRTYQPGENRATSASVEGLPAGTYVIKNGKTSYKVQKK